MHKLLFSTVLAVFFTPCAAPASAQGVYRVADGLASELLCGPEIRQPDLGL